MCFLGEKPDLVPTADLLTRYPTRRAGSDKVRLALTEMRCVATHFAAWPKANISQSDDGPFNQDFDELMRSGATMKVSLTPDRLKTFEVGYPFSLVS